MWGLVNPHEGEMHPLRALVKSRTLKLIILGNKEERGKDKNIQIIPCMWRVHCFRADVSFACLSVQRTLSPSTQWVSYAMRVFSVVTCSASSKQCSWCWPVRSCFSRSLIWWASRGTRGTPWANRDSDIETILKWLGLNAQVGWPMTFLHHVTPPRKREEEQDLGMLGCERLAALPLLLAFGPLASTFQDQLLSMT